MTRMTHICHSVPPFAVMHNSEFSCVERGRMGAK